MKNVLHFVAYLVFIGLCGLALLVWRDNVMLAKPSGLAKQSVYYTQTRNKYAAEFDRLDNVQRAEAERLTISDYESGQTRPMRFLFVGALFALIFTLATMWLWRGALILHSPSFAIPIIGWIDGMADKRKQSKAKP